MNSTSKTPKQVKTLEIRLYGRDQFFAELSNLDGTESAKYTGSVQDDSPVQYRNDYLMLDINISAQRVGNLRKPTYEQIVSLIAQMMQMMRPASQFELAKLKNKIWCLEDKIVFKRQEIETMRKEAEQLYQQLKQL